MILSPGEAARAATNEPPRDLPATSWTLVDPESGDVLAARDSKAAYPIASATKLMTYYLARKALNPREDVVVAPYEVGPIESLAGLEPGDSLTARDLLYGLLVASGNDAATTLAIRVAGSEPDFVSRMNAAARKLGLDDTTYADPIGLDAGNVSSAGDLVDLAVELREDALFRRIVDTPRVTLRSGVKPLRLVNRNTLILEEPFVDGVKTGTTLEAGFVLVASAREKGTELVSAVTGATSEAARDASTLELLRYGFSLYERRTVVKRGERIASVPLTEGRGRLVLEAARSVEIVTREEQRVDVEFDEPQSIEGPVTRGESLGVATVTLDGREVGKVGVLAKSAVAAPTDSDQAVGGLPGWALVVSASAVLLAIGLAAAGVIVHRQKPR